MSIKIRRAPGGVTGAPGGRIASSATRLSHRPTWYSSNAFTSPRIHFYGCIFKDAMQGTILPGPVRPVVEALALSRRKDTSHAP
jgi:hypothetical protein